MASLDKPQQWQLEKQQQQQGDEGRPDGSDVSLQGGYEEEGEGGEAVPQHDGQGDPQDPACGAILPVPNGPWSPALMPGNRPQHSIPCMQDEHNQHNSIAAMCTGTHRPSRQPNPSNCRITLHRVLPLWTRREEGGGGGGGRRWDGRKRV